MTINIGVILYDKGPGGVPTTNNPQSLRGLDSYDQSIANGMGFESATTGWNATANEVIEWARADHLKRPMKAFSPDGIEIWEGFLSEITIKIGNRRIVFSLKEMSNRLRIHYNTDAGAQASTSSYSNAASIAMFGTKDRVLNISTVAPAAADNRAQTVLAMLAFPTSKESSESTTGVSSDHFRIELAFTGDYATLDWVLTSNASQTLTATNTQIIALLASYNSVNNWFSTNATNIVATSVSDTEFIEDETPYRDKIETLLAHGNSSKQRLVWGTYENRVLAVAVWAGATPTVITYFEQESGEITDRYENVIQPWFIRPNAMAEVAYIQDTPLNGAVESPKRKYVARVNLSIRAGSISVQLEPDNVDSIEAMLSGPSGAGPSGTSDRQASFEHAITTPLRTRFSGVNGHVDAGGGSIINTGGGNVDLGTGGGIGGGGGVTPPSGGDPITFGVGVAGRLAEWFTTGRLQAASQRKTGIGILTFDAATDETITIPSGGGGTIDLNGNPFTLDGSLRVSGASPSLNQVLQYDGTRFTPSTLTPSDSGSAPIGAKYIVQTPDSTLTNEQALSTLATGIVKNTATTGVLSIAVAGTDYADPNHTHPIADVTNAAPADAKYIVQTANSTLTNEQALGALATGIVKNTTSTGVLSIAVPNTDYPAVNHTHPHGDITDWNEAVDDEVNTLLIAGANIGLTYDDAAGTLAIAVTGLGEAIDDRVAGLLVEGANITLTYNDTANTLTIAASSSGVSGSGAVGRVATWSSASALTSSVNLFWDSANSRLGIGTASPGKTLDVNGRAIVGGGLISASLGSSLTAASGEIHASDNITSDTGLVTGGTLKTNAGVAYNFGGWTTSADKPINGSALIVVGGVARKFATIA